MTDEQYERWKDFALRMARTCYKRRRAPSAKEIEDNIVDFFECGLPRGDVVCIETWDWCSPYPDGHPNRRRADHGPPCVSDLCADREERWTPPTPRTPSDRTPWATWMPGYWSQMSDATYERLVEKWCGPIKACIRAGLDVAVGQPGGVVGFTAGDLRKMYPEGIPPWLLAQYEDVQHEWSLTTAADAEPIWL